MISGITQSRFGTPQRVKCNSNNLTASKVHFGKSSSGDEAEIALGGLAILILLGGLLVRSCFDTIGQAVKEDNARLKSQTKPAIVDTLVKKVKK